MTIKPLSPGRKMTQSYGYELLMFCTAQKEKLSGRPLSNYPALKGLVRSRVMYPVDNLMTPVRNSVIREAKL